MPNHEIHEHQILTQLESRQGITQRALSKELGIALGLTNLLIRRLVNKGWVRITRVKPSRIQYLITPAGVMAKARLTRAYVRESVRFYRETRNRIRQEFTGLCADLERTDAAGIVFYGAGEVAEIAYVCLQDTTLQLVAVIDPVRSKPFFSAAVCRPADLLGDTVGGRRFERLVVMPVENEDEVRAILTERGVSPDRVFWL